MCAWGLKQFIAEELMLLRWKPRHKTKLPILNWRSKYLDPASLNVLSIVLTWPSDCVYGIGMYLLHVGHIFFFFFLVMICE